MTHRSDRIRLPNDISRCEPSQCMKKQQCARYMAAIPAYGASITDFSRDGIKIYCAGFILIAWANAQANIKPAPVVKDWIGPS